MNSTNKLIAGGVSLLLNALIILGLYWGNISSEKLAQEMQEIEFVPIEWEEPTPLPQPEPTAPREQPGGQASPAPAPTKPAPARSSATVSTPPTPAKPSASLQTNKQSSPMVAPKKQVSEEKRVSESNSNQIDNRLSRAFAQSGEKGNSQPSGASTSSGASPSGSAGWSLEGAGRSIVGNGGVPVIPQNIPDIRGTLKIRIVVNGNGEVIEAGLLLKGSDITDPTIIKKAIEAARKTKFNKTPSAMLQRGIITYRFEVQ